MRQRFCEESREALCSAAEKCLIFSSRGKRYSTEVSLEKRWLTKTMEIFFLQLIIFVERDWMQKQRKISRDEPNCNDVHLARGGCVNRIRYFSFGSGGNKRSCVLTPRAIQVEQWKTLRVGDVVYIGDDNAPPHQWLICRVQYVYSGPDNYVRVAKVRTPTRKYNRPVKKLRRLPLWLS